VPQPSTSLEEKLAELLMVGFTGIAFDPQSPFGRAVSAGRIANTVVFGRNVASPAQLAALTGALTAQAPRPVLVAADQEGGYVARLTPAQGFPDHVSAQYLGSRNDLRLTHTYATTAANALAVAGIGLNLAPVVDLNVNPRNPVIGAVGRSFSAAPGVVADHAMSFIEAHHAAGVLTTLKHFPGHGSSTGDSHLGFVDVTSTWSAQELEPYRRIIGAGLADAIMTAHVLNAALDTQHPATLSQRTIEGLLREELGFNGVVITDDLQMAAISQRYGFAQAIELAFNAGADMLAIANVLAYDADAGPEAFRILQRAVEQGRISVDRVDESYARILRLKSRLSAAAR
jgi:beta-N-acetylhexosaminidase